MPLITDNRPSGYTPVPQSDVRASKGRNAVELDDSPTLQGLLTAFNAADGDPDAPLRAEQSQERVRIIVPKSPGAVPSMWTRFKAALSNLPLFNRSAALRAARIEVSEVPLDQHPSAGAVLRTGILHAIRREIGEGHEGFAELSMDNKHGAKQLTKRTVEVVLKAALAEKSALDSAHENTRKATEYRGRLTPVLREAAAKGMERRVAGISQEISNTHAARPVQDAASAAPPKARQEKPEPALAALKAALSRYQAGRDPKLLDYCAELVGSSLDTSDVNPVAQGAKDLHDRVQAYLARRGKWPIADEGYFDSEIKSLAAAMFTQNA
jgi:hypothetical protein